MDGPKNIVLIIEKVKTAQIPEALEMLYLYQNYSEELKYDIILINFRVNYVKRKVNNGEISMEEEMRMTCKIIPSILDTISKIEMYLSQMD